MPRLYFDVHAASDIGISRQLNEDSSFAEVIHDAGHSSCVMAVADGVGGRDAGDVASKITVEYLQHLFARWGYKRLAQERGIDPANTIGLMRESFGELNKRVRERGATFGLARTMGSTCTIGITAYDSLQDKNYLCFGSIGDSRCYVIRGDEVLLLTRDDSKVWELYEAGEITYSDMRTHPKRNLITQALGIVETITPQVNRYELQTGDRVVMSTDGLHGMISDAEMKSLVQTSPSADAAVSRLIAKANEAGGKDNISVAVLICSGSPVPQDRETALTKRYALNGHNTTVVRSNQQKPYLVVPRRNKWLMTGALIVSVCALAVVAYFTSVEVFSRRPAYHIAANNLSAMTFTVGKDTTILVVVSSTGRSETADRPVLRASGPGVPQNYASSPIKNGKYLVPFTPQNRKQHNIHLSLSTGETLVADTQLTIIEAQILEKQKIPRAIASDGSESTGAALDTETTLSASASSGQSKADATHSSSPPKTHKTSTNILDVAKPARSLNEFFALKFVQKPSADVTVKFNGTSYTTRARSNRTEILYVTPDLKFSEAARANARLTVFVGNIEIAQLQYKGKRFLLAQ